RAEMEPEAPLELDMEIGIRQREDALSLGRRLGPHDRGAPALERQNGERTGRQEMFLGAATVIALMLDRRHDARLRIVPPAGGDAGAPADPGTGARSGH